MSGPSLESQREKYGYGYGDVVTVVQANHPRYGEQGSVEGIRAETAPEQPPKTCVLVRFALDKEPECFHPDAVQRYGEEFTEDELEAGEAIIRQQANERRLKHRAERLRIAELEARIAQLEAEVVEAKATLPPGDRETYDAISLAIIQLCDPVDNVQLAYEIVQNAAYRMLAPVLSELATWHYRRRLEEKPERLYANYYGDEEDFAGRVMANLKREVTAAVTSALDGETDRVQGEVNALMRENAKVIERRNT